MYSNSLTHSMSGPKLRADTLIYRRLELGDFCTLNSSSVFKVTFAM